MSVFILGNAARDRFYRLDRFPGPGQSALVLAHRLDLGGKGFNQAVAAARAGASVHLVCSLGRDPAGRRILRTVEREGIGAEFVELRGTASDESVIWVDPQGEQAIASRLVEPALLPPSLFERLGRRMEPGDRLSVSAFMPPAELGRLGAICRARGARLQINLAPFACDYGSVWSDVDLVVANRREVLLHAGESALERAVQRFLARGIGRLAVTLGSGGVLWTTKEQRLRVPAPAVEVVDTTAAGDVFLGVLTALLATGWQVVEALRAAVHAASLATTRLGALSAIPSAARLRRICCEERRAAPEENGPDA